MSVKKKPTLWSTTKRDWSEFPDTENADFLKELEVAIENGELALDEEEIRTRLKAYDAQITDSALLQIVK